MPCSIASMGTPSARHSLRSSKSFGERRNGVPRRRMKAASAAAKNSLSASVSLIDQAEPLQREERVDRLDPLGASGEKLGETAGRDDARLPARLLHDPVDHAVHERKVPEVEAGLDRSGRRLSDHLFRPPDL